MFQIGMVAWKMTLKTPEYPSGRSIIVIANDICHMIGSFGPNEDILFNVSFPTCSIMVKYSMYSLLALWSNTLVSGRCIYLKASPNVLSLKNIVCIFLGEWFYFNNICYKIIQLSGVTSRLSSLVVNFCNLNLFLNCRKHQSCPGRKVYLVFTCLQTVGLAWV